MSREWDVFGGREYVYAVYKEKSFSKAAEKLCISQPSLSANVKRIERMIGYPIFDRSTSPLKLTEYGAHYIQAAEQIMSVENSFADYINDQGELKKGRLVLGGSSLYISMVLLPLIRSFTEKYPMITLELIEESTSELVRLLASGNVDIIADVCELDKDVFSSKCYSDETLFLAVPKNYNSAVLAAGYAIDEKSIVNNSTEYLKAPPVPMELFRDDPYILLKPENDTRIRAEKILKSAGIKPQAVIEIDQQLTSYHAACSGLGIAFISDTLIKNVHSEGDVLYFRLADPHCRRRIWFYYKAKRYMSRAMKEFLRSY